MVVPVCFLMRDRKGVDPDVESGWGEGLGGVKANYKQDIYLLKEYYNQDKRELFSVKGEKEFLFFCF